MNAIYSFLDFSTGLGALRNVLLKNDNINNNKYCYWIKNVDKTEIKKFLKKLFRNLIVGSRTN